MSDLTFSQKAAKLVSILFVPPSLTLIIFTYLAIALEKDFNHSLIVLLVSFLFGFAIPILMYGILRKTQYVSDFDATIKEQRLFPYFIGIIIYVSGLGVLIFYKVNPITISFWFCYISNTLLIIIITKYWKISAHTFGVAAPLAAITFVLGWVGFIFVVLLFLVGWSRIKLKVHTISQVIAGGAGGFLITYLQMYFIVWMMDKV